MRGPAYAVGWTCDRIHSLEAQTVIGIWQNTYDRLRPPAPVTFPDLAFRLRASQDQLSPE